MARKVVPIKTACFQVRISSGIVEVHGKSLEPMEGETDRKTMGSSASARKIRRKNARKINAVKIGGFRLGWKLMINE